MSETSVVDIISLAISSPTLRNRADHCLRRIHMAALRFRCRNHALFDAANHRRARDVNVRTENAEQKGSDQATFCHAAGDLWSLKDGSVGSAELLVVAVPHARVRTQTVYAPDQPIVKRLEGGMFGSSMRSDKIIGVLGQERIIERFHETSLGQI